MTAALKGAREVFLTFRNQVMLLFQTKTHQEASTLGTLQKLGLIRPGWAPTFEEFTKRLEPLLQQLFQLVRSWADVSSMAQLMYAVCIIHSAGGATFQLEPGLIKLLQETGLPRGMSMEFLRLPFEGINLDIPAGTLRPPMDSVTRLFLVHVPGDRFRIVCTPNEVYTHFVSIRSTSEGTIEDAVAETKARAFEGIPKAAEDEMRNNWIYSDYYTSDFFVLPVNAALYITSGGADVEQDKTRVRALHTKLQGLKKKNQRERLEQELKDEKTHQIFICGGHLKLSQEMLATFTEKGRKLTKRFRVRGHWCNQSVGPKQSGRKHIWIAPHWRGPTYAELLERNYVVVRGGKAQCSK